MANKAGLKPRRVNRSVMGAPLSLQKRPPQPDQDVLEWLADLDFHEGLLSSASRGFLLNQTRISWKGWQTWMSRKAWSHS